jgi:hypothetical protein
VRSAYSTCPPRPQPACQPALGLVDDNTHALASIVPPLRGRRKDARVLLSSSVSPYNVAVRHYRARGLETERTRESEKQTRTLPHATTQRGLPQTCSALRYRANDERGTKRPSRNCHVSLAPGTWPYLGGTNAALDHSLGVQVWKSKVARRSTVYVRSLAAYLHEGPPTSCCRYRVCYLHELAGEQSLGHAITSPETATSLAP